MLSLPYIREHEAEVRQAMANRRADVPLDRVLERDRTRRANLIELENLKARQNQLGSAIGRVKDPAERQPLINENKSISPRIAELENIVREADEELERLILDLPNLPDESVPVGLDAEENVEVRRWGAPGDFPFEPLPHWELGERLGILDFERGVKLAGARSVALAGAGAALSRALIAFMLELHTSQHGYTEIAPPYLVKPEVMRGTGQLPKFADDAYVIERDDLYLIPTGEVPVTNLHAGEILEPGLLPVYYCAHTPCFRREAGSAGRDTRGLIRVHQFDKVEMIKLTEPERSLDELEAMVVNAETVLQRLGLAYRVMLLCTGDLGFSSRKTYDLEVWMPGQNRYVEISSCSTCGDFQARRADIKFRRASGERAEYVHTLNGSGLAVGRTLAAVLETYQNQDGTVRVPAALQPFMGGREQLIAR